MKSGGRDLSRGHTSLLGQVERRKLQIITSCFFYTNRPSEPPRRARFPGSASKELLVPVLVVERIRLGGGRRRRSIAIRLGVRLTRHKRLSITHVPSTSAGARGLSNSGGLSLGSELLLLGLILAAEEGHHADGDDDGGGENDGDDDAAGVKLVDLLHAGRLALGVHAAEEAVEAAHLFDDALLAGARRVADALSGGARGVALGTLRGLGNAAAYGLGGRRDADDFGLPLGSGFGGGGGGCRGSVLGRLLGSGRLGRGRLGRGVGLGIGVALGVGILIIVRLVAVIVFFRRGVLRVGVIIIAVAPTLPLAEILRIGPAGVVVTEVDERCGVDSGLVGTAAGV